MRRGALAKALNSLSWQPDLVLPRAVDPDQTVFAVDVGELSQQLADALTAAGHPSEHARSANVHELAAGTWQPTETEQEIQP